MSVSGPMGTFFGLQERKVRFIDMSRHNESDVTAYQCYGANNIIDAYGDPGGAGTSGVGGADPTALFTVNRGLTYVSPSLRRSGRVVQETHRGLTWSTLDIEDFLPGADASWLFLRWQQYRPTLGAWVTMNTGEGLGPEPLYCPIYCVPGPEIFCNPGNASFTLGGIAPAGTACVAGSAPVFNEQGQDALGNPVMPPLDIVFHRPCSTLIVRNVMAAPGPALLVAFASDQPMLSLPAGQEVTLYTGSVKELVLASGGVAANFSLIGSLYQ
jgi:hypothetical protein